MTETRTAYRIGNLSLEVAPQSLRNEKPTIEQLEQQGHQLKAKQDRLWLDIGNWAVTIANYYGVSAYERLLAICGFDNQATMVEDWAYVCRNVPKEVQRDDLSFSHHRAVAPIKDHSLQSDLLQVAIDKDLNVREFRNYIKQLGGDDPPQQAQPAYKSDREFALEMELHQKEVEYQEERTQYQTTIQQLQRTTAPTVRPVVERIQSLLLSLDLQKLIFSPSDEYKRIRGELEAIRQELERVS